MEHDFDHEIHELLSFEAIKDGLRQEEWAAFELEMQERDRPLINDLLARAIQHDIVIPPQVVELCDQTGEILPGNTDAFRELYVSGTTTETSQALIEWLQDLHVHTAIALYMMPEAAVAYITEQRHIAVYKLSGIMDDLGDITSIVQTTNDYIAAHFPELPIVPLQPNEVYEQRKVQREFILCCDEAKARNYDTYTTYIGSWRELCREVIGEHDDLEDIQHAIVIAFKIGLKEALNHDWLVDTVPPASMLANLNSLDEQEKETLIDYVTAYITLYTVEDFERKFVPWELDEALIDELAYYWVMLHGFMMTEKGYIP